MYAQATLTSSTFAASETGGSNAIYYVNSPGVCPTGAGVFVLAGPSTIYLVYNISYNGSLKVYGSLTAVPIG